MKKNNFDIEKLIADLTESEKLRLYGFILGLKENREKAVDGPDDAKKSSISV